MKQIRILIEEEFRKKKKKKMDLRRRKKTPNTNCTRSGKKVSIADLPYLYM